MSAYIVAYDLRKKGRNYDCVHEKLNRYPWHWHMQESVWVIQTTQSAVQICDSLESCLDSNDTLFVGKLSREVAGEGLPEEGEEWLKNVLSSNSYPFPRV